MKIAVEPLPNQLTAQLVQTPQPTSNATQALNQKQPFQHKVFIDEVVGLAFLLLLI